MLRPAPAGRDAPITDIGFRSPSLLSCQLLSAFPRALSPTLPPSPPASRSASPEPAVASAAISRPLAGSTGLEQGSGKTSIPSPPSETESGRSHTDSQKSTSSRGARSSGGEGSGGSDWASNASSRRGEASTLASLKSSDVPANVAGEEATPSSSSSSIRERKRRRVDPSVAGDDDELDVRHSTSTSRRRRGRGYVVSEAEQASRQAALTARAATVWDADKFRALAHTCAYIRPSVSHPSSFDPD
jgi:hypothetical protein